MKTISIKIIFFALIFPVLSFAQNWQPVHLNWKYNYKTDSSAIITNTIWIDSSEVINGDSVYYLNRIVTHCDTCHAALGGPNPCDSCYALSNQPQFLQRKITKLANGIFYFNDTSKMVINSLASLNDTWLFDSVANTSAQVISVATGSVFGTIDSVKTILLTNGDTLKLSMNYGILKFPHLYFLNSYFNLVGIEGLNVGEKVPGFWEIFDFNVGDVFHYVGGYFDASTLPSGDFFHRDRQYTITSKMVYSDSIVYNYSGIEWGYFNFFQFNWPYNGTMKFIDSVGHFANFYSHQFLNTYFRQLILSPDDPHYLPDSIYDYVELSMDSNNLFTKYFGNSSSFNNYILVDSTNDLMQIVDLQTNGTGLRTSTLEYKVGLGQTGYSYGFFEHGGGETLIGYIKNGNTTGTILSTANVELLNQFSIYPNPAKEKTNIHLAATSIGKVLITDNSGRKILGKDFNGTQIELDVSSISSGLYFLSVITEKGLFTQKIIVARE